SNPADIVFGTALSATQLNATASTLGNFDYTPASGTVLAAGQAQTLSVQFTPTDNANWNTPAKASVSINVLPSGGLSLTVDPNPVEPNKTVTFTIGLNAGQTAFWDFGDGTPVIQGSSVTHSYSAVGTYTIVVTITDG